MKLAFYLQNTMQNKFIIVDAGVKSRVLLGLFSFKGEFWYLYVECKT